MSFLTRSPFHRAATAGALAVLASVLVPTPARSQAPEPETSPSNPLVALLTEGRPVFGIFSGEQTPEQGRVVARNREADFVLYSMERPPFDVPRMEAYMGGIADAARADGIPPIPVLLRVPPVGEDAEGTRTRVARALDAGVGGIVFPHVTTAAQAAVSVASMRDLWPADPQGTLLDVLIIEDREGVANARDIVRTPGLGVVFAGPGDLRRAYQGDAEAIEGAIQTVLAACKEFGVPCGITAGAEDIARRLEQGFRVIIVTEPEALAVGRRASGRASG